MFKKGDLLLCVANNVENPIYVGIPPEIGQYYTWRGYSPTPGYGYVEEIISPIGNHGYEAAHLPAWYVKQNVNINIEGLLEETLLETT